MPFYNPFSWGTKSVQVETKSTGKVLGLSDELGAFLQLGNSGSAATPAGAMALYRKSTAVSIPINYIAESFASINPVLREGDEIITDHPVLDLLRSPSPFFTRELFLENIAKNFLIAAESPVVAIGNINRPPLELQPINPGNASPVEGVGGIIRSINVSGDVLPGAYDIEIKNKSVRYISGNLTEMKFIRGYNTRNNSMVRGQSLLVSASAEVMQQITGNEHNVKLLENGGRVSLIFHFGSGPDGADSMAPDDFEETKQQVREQFGGSGNAGEIGVTTGGNLNVQELSKSNRDMDYHNLQQMAQKSIALQYKFPLPLLTTEASTLNNYRESKTALYDDAVLPLADRLFGGLSDFLMPRYGLDPAKIRITYDLDQITALAGRRSEELILRKDLGIFTTNELREMVGRPGIENGDTLLVPATLVPIGTDLFADDQGETE
jgi:HK97 family phage portal protein